MHIRVEDGVVKQCVEELPTDPQGDWREVVDITPVLINWYFFKFLKHFFINNLLRNS